MPTVPLVWQEQGSPTLLLGREARYFAVLFYSTIFETIMSFKIDLEDMLEKPKKDRSIPTGFHHPQS